MVALAEGQYEVGGLVLGAGTPYVVKSFEDEGLPGRRVQDSGHSFDDGLQFGRDYFDGKVGLFDVLVETAGGGPSFDAVAAMLKAWRGDAVRRSPGRTELLRVRRPGATTRRAYGRPRRCTPVRSRNTGVGLVPMVADFQCADDKWYDDEAQVETLGILPPSTSGFYFPLVFPMSSAAVTERPGILTCGGDLPTWPVVRINGPVTNPAVELRTQGGARLWLLEFTYSLAEGQSIIVDPRPWARTVLRENGGNVSGSRTRTTTPLESVTLPVGQSVILFRGTSASGTATCSVTYEPAYVSY